MPTHKPRYSVFVTPEEKARIEKQRAETGLGISEYFRTIVLKGPVIVLPDKSRNTLLYQLWREMNRLGGLYKMELSNEERFYGHEDYREKVDGIHSQIKDVIQKLAATLGKMP